jgi:hypothetical protein
LLPPTVRLLYVFLPMALHYECEVVFELNSMKSGCKKSYCPESCLSLPGIARTTPWTNDQKMHIQE